MKTSMTVLALSLILVGCGSEGGSDAPTRVAPAPDTKFTPAYNLSAIPVTCADANNEVFNSSVAGISAPMNSIVYIYPSVGDAIGNACSPTGTDFPAFLVSDSLNNVIAYSQLVGTISYEYQYVTWTDPRNISATGDTVDADLTPVYLEVDYNNGTVTTVDLMNHTKTINTNGSETVYSDYTSADFMIEYPKQLHHETALNLFKLSNNQKPSL